MGHAREKIMITGELKNKIDRIWDTLWSGGISNPLSVIEQLTYLLFIRRLDELETLAENGSWVTAVWGCGRSASWRWWWNSSSPEG